MTKEVTRQFLFDSQGRSLKSFSPASSSLGTLKIKFGLAREYFILGEGGTRVSLIKDPLFYTSRIAGNVKDWEYVNWFIVNQILVPQSFTVLGSNKRFHNLIFEGPQSLLAQFQKTGFLDPRVEASGDSGKIIEFKSTPKGGPLLVSAFRVKRNGKPDF
ncbi:MAG: hypothetical protein KIT39_08395 [Nitrospirales bacterium]|nr:hypothetical protein [Nitrospirales bacterium]